MTEEKEKDFLEGTMGPVEIATRARVAARHLASLASETKREILRKVADGIDAARDVVLEANRADVLEARTTFEEIPLAASALERLKLDETKVRGMADGVRAVAELPDPSGRALSRTLLDDGLVLEKVTCPLGVLLVIFESRPDAVAQIGSLALKSGNAAILKGGRESARSTAALLAVFVEAFAAFPEIPEGTLSSVAGRAEVDALLALDGEIDLVIPRGGYDLVRHVQASTRIPVLGHAEGVCHVYVDREADEAMAIRIVLDSKLQYPAACNAAETLLVHRDAAARFLAPLLGRLLEAGVEIRACAKTRALAPSLDLAPAAEEDWRTEYGGPTLSVKIVESLDEAVEHVNRHGSHHTEAIVTADKAAAEAFLARVDAAGVFHNASTRFADGFRYGFGAEVGISTSRIHARGPVGLDRKPDRFAQDRELRRVLHDAQLPEERRGVEHGERLGAARREHLPGRDELLAELPVVRVEVVERLRSLEKRPGFLLEVRDRMGGVGSEFLRAFDAGAATRPLLLGPDPGLDEQRVALSLRRAGPENRNRVRLGKARDIPEIRVRPVRVEVIPGRIRRGAQDHDRIRGELRGERRAMGGEPVRTRRRGPGRGERRRAGGENGEELRNAHETSEAAKSSGRGRAPLW